MTVARSSISPLVRLSLPGLVLLGTFVVPAEAAVKKMFVTSVSGSANLSTWLYAQGESGLAAGDAICQTLAHDGAGLPTWQDFRAWLSTSTQDAYCRVAGFDGLKANDCGEFGLPDAGPWERMDGEPFAESLFKLTNDWAVLRSPVVDETGATPPITNVFTGTEYTGAADPGLDCSGWTVGTGNSARVGSPSAGGISWTSAFNGACGPTGRLYCFESGSGDSLPPWEEPGNLVFTTSVYGSGDLGSWPQAGTTGAVGLAAGDAICQTLAADAALPAPDSFVAWLSTAAVDAVDRVTSNGPFKRVDGLQVAASRADLLTAYPYDLVLESAIVVDETGAYKFLNVYTGSDGLGTSTLHDCNGWTSAATGADASYGYVQETRGFWTTSGNSHMGCSFSRGFFCFSKLAELFRDGFGTGNTSRWSTAAP